jgi:hypothetical protein
MIIDMPITTQTVDSSGEILHLKGLDISDFNDGRAFANFEHNNDHADNIVGKFVFAKKIFNSGDCATERQKMYWEKLQTPFLYGVCELFDQEGHPGAVAIAAMIRYFVKRKEPVMVGASIEGQTLERKDGDLLRTVGRRTALTLRPCNRQCWTDFLGEGEASDKFMKSMEDGLDQERLVTVDSSIVEDMDTGDVVQDLKKALEALNKTLTAGTYAGTAPEGLTGGAALQVEDRGLRNRMKAVYRDWDRRRPLREVLKAALPDVADSYVDHFVDLTRDLALKKGLPHENLTRVSAQHSLGADDNDDQKKLLEGLYWDQSKPFQPSHPQHSAEIRSLQNDAGKRVLVKLNRAAPTTANQTATAYYRLAKDFYGMGDHVPVTAHFRHGMVNGGIPMQAIEFVEGAKTPLESSKMMQDAYMKAREDGSMHKLALMDAINGTADRHGGNIMIRPDGKLLHIDNDEGISDMPVDPSYLTRSYLDKTQHFDGIGEDTLHRDAAEWLAGLDWRKLAAHARRHGVDQPTISSMASRLAFLQRAARHGMTFRQMFDHMKGQDQLA